MTSPWNIARFNNIQWTGQMRWLVILLTEIMSWFPAVLKECPISN